MAGVITYDVNKAILEELVAATKQIVFQYNTLQRSELIDSIEWSYNDNLFIMIANDYFKWVDTGRKPQAKMVPIEPLIKWIRKKGIRPGFGQTTNNLAWAIRVSIYKVGITPKPMTQQIIGQSIEFLSEELAVDLSVKLADEISKELTFTLGKN